MITCIKFSDEFQKSFKQLKKRYRSLPEDFKTVMNSLVENPIQGDEMHDGMRKIRIGITSKNRGKRGGGRVIIRVAISDTELSFLYIYDKSDMPSVSDSFLNDIIKQLDN